MRLAPRIASFVCPGVWGGIACVVLAGLLPGLADAGTVLPQGPSFYTDHKGHRIGDVITILIVENSSATNSTSTETQSKANHDVAGAGRLDFVDVLSLGVDSETRGGGTTRRQGNLTARMTANVTEIDETGHLVVEGTRTIVVNGEDEKIVLRGRLRPQDVRPDNTAYSTYLADASIEFSGKGVLNTAARPGILSRILNWIF